MCGIAGLLSRRGPVTVEILRAMTDRIVARGPDSQGEWISDDGRVGLAHRRLAIIDLSSAGHQPMTSPCGRYWLTYNGEIYNFRELRAELEAAGKAPAWRGHSDTEVILAAIGAWGFRATLKKMSGMFALALWDRSDQRLTLARDRFGEKPLYYGWTKSGFAFASTLGPIAATPQFDNGLSQPALTCLMARACIPAPYSIRERVFKLPPGSLLTVGPEVADRPQDEPHPDVEQWFDYADQVLAGAANPVTDREQAIAELEEVLTTAVTRQLVADVPVGTFLSGGIDSSLITAIAQKCVDRPIKTFTIGFTEARFDEAVHARQVAAALGTDHTELYLSANDALAVIPSLASIYDEPFADSSQIPTFLVSRMAREKVTVSLSGDGGDELFGGYNRHIRFPQLWRAMAKFPSPLRRASLGLASAMPPALWNGALDLARRERPAWYGDNVRRALRLTGQARSFDDLYDRFLDDWWSDGSPLSDRTPCPRRLSLDPRLSKLPLEVQMMHADATGYLPNDILTKVDRAGMAVSLESRIPFLDPAVTAFAARVSPSLNFVGAGGKDLLKQLLYRHVPQALVDRPKAGFAIPLGTWLQGPLRDWAENLLSPEALSADGLFDVARVRNRWQRHLTGREEATQPLWSILMFQCWREGQ